jgi:cytochrome c biogenesis protein CcmG, thiol:disulfide interchange protein DsbE
MRAVRLGAQALSVLLVVGLLGLLVWKVSHQVGRSTVAAEVRKGKRPQAPSFTLPRLDGGQLASSQFAGKAQVVNFWASWCIPCREETPLLERAAKRITVVGIDHQDFAGDARGFARKYGMTYTSVRDQGDKLYAEYGLTGVPETFCVNRHGQVVAHVPGAVTRESLDECIRDALSS